MLRILPFFSPWLLCESFSVQRSTFRQWSLASIMARGETTRHLPPGTCYADWRIASTSSHDHVPHFQGETLRQRAKSEFQFGFATLDVEPTSRIPLGLSLSLLLLAIMIMIFFGAAGTASIAQTPNPLFDGGFPPRDGSGRQFRENPGFCLHRDVR